MANESGIPLWLLLVMGLGSAAVGLATIAAVTAVVVWIIRAMGGLCLT